MTEPTITREVLVRPIKHAILSRFAARRQRHRERQLTYCYKRCTCGALYAIDSAKRAWDCSDIILGLAVPAGEPGSVTHDDTMPFIFWKVKQAPLDWAIEHRVERVR